MRVVVLYAGVRFGVFFQTYVYIRRSRSSLIRVMTIMSWDLVTIREAAKLLFVHPNTLRNHETPDGKWTEVLGLRIRVYRFDGGQRRYDRAEIIRKIERLKKAR